MTGASIEIRTATASERQTVVATIVAAFIADPIARFAWLSAQEHFEGMPRVTDAFAGGSFEHGSAYVSGDLRGAALWLPPGAHPDAEEVERVFRDTVDARRLDDLLGTFEKMDEWHPEEPHWYLPLIGVEPWGQGSGIGAALLRHSTERCDRDGLPAYLESSNPRNIPLYERHGFEAMGRIQVGAGPLVTPMLRRPRRAS